MYTVPTLVPNVTNVVGSSLKSNTRTDGGTESDETGRRTVLVRTVAGVKVEVTY